jgi:alcohol dehydrogenase class IV
VPTFQYANPATIHWGAGCVREKLGGEIDKAGAKKVLLVTTRSAQADPALGPAVISILGARHAGMVLVGQHAPVQALMSAVEAARSWQIDAMVSLGGGSPIDGSKAISFALRTGIDLRLPDAQARGKTAPLDGLVPHFAIATTLSVAELSGSAGFSAPETNRKVGIAFPALRPTQVFYDGEIAVRTPLPLWLTTGIRAVDHAVETLLAPGDHPLPDLAALDGLRRLRHGLLAARERPQDPAARTEAQLGAWFSYLLPGTAASGLSHTLGKRIGAPFGIAHGVTSCLLLPHVLRHLAPARPEAARRIAEVLEADDAASGVEALLAQLGVPRHLAEYGLSEPDLVAAARDVAGAGHSESDLLRILHAAL